MDLGNFGTEGCGVVVTSYGQLDAVTSGKGGARKTCPDCRRGHARDYDWGFTQEPREGCVEMTGSIAVGGEAQSKYSDPDLNSHGMKSVPRFYQTRCPLLASPVLAPDIARIIQLVALGLISENDNADSPSAQNPGDNRADPVGSAGAEINAVGGSLWGVNGLGPVERERENLFCDGPHN